MTRSRRLSLLAAAQVCSAQEFRAKRFISRIVSLLALGSFLSAIPRVAYSQSDGQRQPADDRGGCARLWCEQEFLLTLAVDSVIDAAAECKTTEARVLRTLHLAPRRQSGFGGHRQMVPSSPPVVRLEDFEATPFFRSSKRIELVDSLAVIEGRVPDTACVIVLSPPQYRGESAVVIEVAVSRWAPQSRRQVFVILRKRIDGWRVDRLESGIER